MSPLGTLPSLEGSKTGLRNLTPMMLLLLLAGQTNTKGQIAPIILNKADYQTDHFLSSTTKKWQTLEQGKLLRGQNWIVVEELVTKA